MFKIMRHRKCPEIIGHDPVRDLVLYEIARLTKSFVYKFYTICRPRIVQIV